MELGSVCRICMEHKKGVIMKRGTDHEWIVIKYKDDCAVYARCKCGFEYNCGQSKRLDDGTWSLMQYPTILYLYCPYCGARKKRYNEEPVKLDKNRWERKE